MRGPPPTPLPRRRCGRTGIHHSPDQDSSRWYRKPRESAWQKHWCGWRLAWSVSECSDGWSSLAPQNVTRSDAVYVAGGGTCSRIDRTGVSNPPLLPVSGSNTGKSLLTHFHTLCPASTSRADDAPRKYFAGIGALNDTSRILKKSAG